MAVVRVFQAQGLADGYYLVAPLSTGELGIASPRCESIEQVYAAVAAEGLELWWVGTCTAGIVTIVDHG